MPPNHIVMIMLDGVGVPAGPLSESIYSHSPAIRELFTDHSVRIDATLGVDGIPQSATGQTSILTGINGAAAIGQHLHGFPNARLRDIIERNNIFSKLLAAGKTCTFANAYALKPERVFGMAVRSATTVAMMAALGAGRTKEDLMAGRAVYHDLTREWLAPKADFEVPRVTEEEAAEHLLTIVRSVDFCLFEFFLTDLIGHRGSMEEKRDILSSLDRFLAALLERMDMNGELLLLVSDHGNIEEPEHRRHTANPVPFCAVGRDADAALQGMKDLTDVTPRIVKLVQAVKEDGTPV